MHSRWHRRCAARLLAAVCLLLVPAVVWARSDIPIPPDLLNGTYAGVQRILELDGKNVHNCGNVLLHIANFGLIGSRPGSNASYSGAPSAQWPKGSPTEYLWSAGLWVGAIKNGERHVSTAQFQVEYRPGRGELDKIYRTREGAPGGARAPAPNADDDRDGLIDEDWLDGRDNDDDGKIDEDFAAISNQMFWCEYGDTDPNIKLALPEHVPLEIWVQQASLCWEAPNVDDFIAFDYRIINRGFSPLEEVYLGFFADCDIGPREAEQVAEDDYAGFWEGVQTAQVGNDRKNVKVSVGYMWDDDTDEAKSEGYVGLMFLGAQDPNSDGIPRPLSLRNFRFFSGRASFDQGGDPNNDEERYRVLDGTAPRSLGAPDPETGFREPQIAKRKDDYRMCVSAGPFATMEEGDTLGFQAALVIGRLFEGLLENGVQAQLTYDGAYLDCDEDPLTGLNGRETALCPPRFQGTFCVNVCDSTCLIGSACDASREDVCVVRVTDACKYVNADCEEEKKTGIDTGVEGKECLIHWLIGTAPPPPNMRLIAKEGQVDILWDNRSETSPDLRLNVIDFESYRIWRADNWTRPFGTDVNTGPGGDLWALLAEYDLAGNHIGSDTGLESIRYQPSIPDRAVQYYREWYRAHPFLAPPDLPGFTVDQLDTAQALARGVRYYRYTDPPFLRGGCGPNGDQPCTAGPCPADGKCPTVDTPNGPAGARCNRQGLCQATTPAPHSGAHYFYAVTATDHKVDFGAGGALTATGPGLAGDPSSNFIYLNPPTDATPREQAGDLESDIYVVPNPATPTSMKPWTLEPNNEDPTGVKIEFHHLPKSTGKVTVFTLAGDMVKELQFDGTSGNGSLAWDLVSRNGQDVTSGVYLFSVEADDTSFKRFVGKFVVIR
jgi:hypothetical protein